MKIINVIGGIGNQLFQYAFYESVKNAFPTENVKLDTLGFVGYELHQGYELANVFSLTEPYCTEEEKNDIYNPSKSFFSNLARSLRISTKFGFVEKKSERLHEVKIPLKHQSEDVYYKGYWQSHQYFNGIEQTLRDKLVFPAIDEEKNLTLLGKMAGKETVSIHIRRGDYNNHPNLGGICDLEYYRNAIERIKDNVTQPLFIIFSDSIEWCQENINIPDAIYVDWNTGHLSYRDMQLMSLCQHNIIPNSTFSWWGAWLNQNPNKIVIAPNKWMNEIDYIDGIFPDTWEKVSVK